MWCWGGWVFTLIRGIKGISRSQRWRFGAYAELMFLMGFQSSCKPFVCAFNTVFGRNTGSTEAFDMSPSATLRSCTMVVFTFKALSCLNLLFLQLGGLVWKSPSQLNRKSCQNLYFHLSKLHYCVINAMQSVSERFLQQLRKNTVNADMCGLTNSSEYKSQLHAVVMSWKQPDLVCSGSVVCSDM